MIFECFFSEKFSTIFLVFVLLLRAVGAQNLEDLGCYFDSTAGRDGKLTVRPGRTTISFIAMNAKKSHVAEPTLWSRTKRGVLPVEKITCRKMLKRRRAAVQAERTQRTRAQRSSQVKQRSGCFSEICFSVCQSTPFVVVKSKKVPVAKLHGSIASCSLSNFSPHNFLHTQTRFSSLCFSLFPLLHKKELTSLSPHLNFCFSPNLCTPLLRDIHGPCLAWCDHRSNSHHKNRWKRG